MKRTILQKTTFNIILLASLLFSSCYSWYEERVNMDHSSKQTTLSDFFHEDSEITALEAPKQVLASKGLYSGSVKVNWAQVPHASSYRIERAVVKSMGNNANVIPEESDFVVVEKYYYKTTYEDRILSNPTATNEEYGNKYYYRISAENINKGYESSEYSDISKSSTEGLGWLLPAPGKLDAWKGKSQTEIKLTWTAVDKALNYIIYRGTNQNGSGMEKIATILASNLSYYDIINESEQGVNFYYKVCAKLPNGSESAFTSLAMGYSLKPGAPTCPDGINITSGFGDSTSSIQLNWNSISFSDTNYNLTYSLFRTSSVDSVYTLVESNISSTTTSKTISEGLKPGIVYYFYLQSVATHKNTGEKLVSAFSDTGPDSESPVLGFLLSAPDYIEVLDTDSTNQVKIIWTPAVGYNLLPDNDVQFQYRLYAGDETGESYDYTIINQPDQSFTNSDGYYDIIVPKHPFYKISTIKNGLESSLSNAAAPTPSAPNNVYATKCEGGKLVTMSKNVNEIYPVKITWEKPDNENPYGYYVYRSTKPDSSFRKLNEDPITADQKLEFIDENETARAGSYYYYKVVSLNSLLQGKKGNDPSSDPNNKARGYGAISCDQWFREYNKTVKKSQAKLSLMHKPNDMDKLGSESVSGDISGSLSYNASIAGLGAEITMHYDNYADYYISNNPAFGPYFVITGNTDTTSNMSANGNMHGTASCTGMYPGSADYGSLEIKGGAAGGGSYKVETKDLAGNIIFSKSTVDWRIGEE